MPVRAECVDLCRFLEAAVKKAVFPPPELKIALASCCLCEEGSPPISREHALELLQEALSQQLYVEGAFMMWVIFYGIQNDGENQQYWRKVLNDLKAKKQFCPPLEPTFLIHS